MFAGRKDAEKRPSSWPSLKALPGGFSAYRCPLPHHRAQQDLTAQQGTAATPDASQEEERVQKHRKRLAAIAAGGQAGQYGLVVRGQALTADKIDALDNTEIENMYARYEARLGAAMTKTLRSAVLQLYAGIAAMFLPIPAENQPGLIADLEGDPFVGHALSTATCELYHRYGMFLAALTAGLTTLKHVRFGHCCPIRVHNDRDEAGEPRVGGGASTV